jgi:peptidoglycan hydrolase CwlO-like protein
LVELKQVAKKKETLETVCVQEKSETQEAKGHITELERRVEDIFGKLPTTAQGSELSMEKQINRIVHAIDQYQKEIETLRG